MFIPEITANATGEQKGGEGNWRKEAVRKVDEEIIGGRREMTFELRRVEIEMTGWDGGRGDRPILGGAARAAAQLTFGGKFNLN
jgi:hypothetical protein